MKQIKIKELEKLNKLLRYWILDMTTTAGSGHPTSSLSAVELMSTLMFSGVFRFDVKKTGSLVSPVVGILSFAVASEHQISVGLYQKYLLKFSLRH